jgi:hypothetical protein
MKFRPQRGINSGTLGSKPAGPLYSRVVVAACGLVLCIILVAGLWPFRAPPNGVSWSKNEHGIRLHRGTLVSRDAFHSASSQAIESCSFEVSLKPLSTSNGGVILAFDSSPDGRTPFSLRQYGTSLAIQRYAIDEHGMPQRPWLKVDGVVHEDEQSLVTVTSGKGRTTVYVNGVMVGQSLTLGMIKNDLTGRLVVGTSTVDQSWTGEIAALAIYERELTSLEVARHSQDWAHSGKLTMPLDGTTMAFYRFDNREGNTIRNEIDQRTDLIAPAAYRILHPAYLRPLWDDFNDSGAAWKHWNYWKDISVNVAGFIPVGFVIMTYFSSVKIIRYPILIVVVVGFAISFTIETLQYFLPTRDSSISDLLTNTLGTVFGIALYRVAWVWRLSHETRTGVISSFDPIPEASANV